MGDDSYAAALREQIAQAVNDVRETTPLAQSFTNFVTMNLVANAQPRRRHRSHELPA